MQSPEGAVNLFIHNYYSVIVLGSTNKTDSFKLFGELSSTPPLPRLANLAVCLNNYSVYLVWKKYFELRKLPLASLLTGIINVSQ